MAKVVIFVYLTALPFVVFGFAIDDADDDIASVDLKGEMIGGNFQGDMILTEKQRRNLEFGPRNGLVDQRFRWPKNRNGKVVVPYEFKNRREFSE